MYNVKPKDIQLAIIKESSFFLFIFLLETVK